MKPIKFGTDGWRAIIGDGFTLDNLTRVTEATASWLARQSGSPSVMVGYDCRFNGKLFAETVANVLAHHGIKVFLSPGFVSTPMVSLATFKRQCTCGIIITASHNPPEYSGYKVKGAFGGPALPSQIAEIESLIPEAPGSYSDNLGAFFLQKRVEYYDMESLYINHLRQAFDLDLIRNSGFRLGYDAMYGAGQRVIRKLFPEAELLHCEHNPGFGGVAPEPIEKNLEEFSRFIRDKGLSIGLATDGDADRIGLYNDLGEFVDSHHILLLLCKYLHQVKGMEGKVIATFSVSRKLRTMAEKYGLPFVVTAIGFKYVCEIMLRENVLVGGEESGGIAVAGHIPERDGIYMGLMVMEMMARSGKSLRELIAEVYAEVGSFAFVRNDLHLQETEKQRVIRDCIDRKYARFGEFSVQELETIDGFKFHVGNDSWVMIRPSGTEPVLRVYAEAPTTEMATALLQATIGTILPAVPAH